jgi:hypothetical protein
MNRRHAVGDSFEVDGMSFRIRYGSKGEDDQILEMLGPLGWSPVSFALGFVVMDVLGQNEDILYPHGAGGGYLHRALLQAYRDGWRSAWARLQEERKRASERRELGGAA